MSTRIVRRGSAAVRPVVALAVFGVLLAGCAPAERVVAPDLQPGGLRKDVSAAAAGSVVISQVYGGGSNSGATFTHDFVELYNAGTASVSLTGWSVQYASATGTGNFAAAALAGTIAPGRYYLVRLAGGSVGAPLPTADATGSLNLSGSTGKVALVSQATGLACNGGSAPCSAAQLAAIVDLVGFGTANFFEGSAPAPGLSNTTAALRKNGGCTDTNDNAADFVAGTPTPRNTATTPVPCAAGPALTVTVSRDPLAIEIGQTSTLTAAVTQNGQAVTPTSIVWSVTPAGAVTFSNQSGNTVVATGVVAGNASVTATVVVNGQTYAGTSALGVTAPLPPGGVTTSIGVSRSTPLPVGFQAQFFATPRDANGVELDNVTVTWRVKPGSEALATITTNGVVNALAAGRAYFIARASDSGFEREWYLDQPLPTQSPNARYGDNTEFGTPTDQNASDDFVVRRPQFAASWNRFRGQPNWVAYNLEATHRGSAPRCDCFTTDPLLPSDFPVITTFDYTGSGYSRGHMTMSEDRTASLGDNAQTFYLSNIIPQTSANNGGPWLALETYLGGLATGQNKEIYIISGGAKYEGTLNGAGKVAIPTRTWKVAVIMPRDQGLAQFDEVTDAQIIAVDMPNATSMPSTRWQDYVVTVDSLESLTGYDFLASLPDFLEGIVESGDRAPTAVITGAGLAGGLVAQPLTFSGATSTDPDVGGALNDQLSYMWAVDGVVAGIGPQLTTAFTTAGTHTVRLIVADRFGFADTTSASVTILSAVQGVGVLADLVQELGANASLPRAEANSLAAKLRASAQLLAMHADRPAGIAVLAAFIHEIEAMAQSDRLDDAKAERLIDYARLIIRSAGG